MTPRIASPTPFELQLALSTAALPFVVGLVTLTILDRQLRDWSEVSEELFRGDRLPVLPFPDAE